MKQKIVLFLFSLFFYGCQTSQAANQQRTMLPVVTNALSAHQQAAHKIAIRVNESGASEFYARETDTTFMPRGYNYTHVMALTEPCLVTNDIYYHSTFNIDIYDPVEAQAMLSNMQAAQYNVVRVFLNPECMTDVEGNLLPEYIANLADFLRLAQTYDQTVILTIDQIPSTWYGDPIQTEDDIWWINSQYLFADEIAIEKAFWQKLIITLGAQEAPLETILAYELRNELYFHPELPPLNQDNGIINTSNGKTYDMSLVADKERMVAENMVYWSQQIRDTIRVLEPTALVTVGFFAPEPFGTPSHAAIFDSELDFVDLHMYPQENVAQADYVDYFGLNEQPRKLLVMGEYGVVKGGETLDEVADKLQNWQRESCQHNLSGWLLWTWTTKDGVELSMPDDDTLFNALAPATRPNPCG